MTKEQKKEYARLYWLKNGEYWRARNRLYYQTHKRSTRRKHDHQCGWCKCSIAHKKFTALYCGSKCLKKAKRGFLRRQQTEWRHNLASDCLICGGKTKLQRAKTCRPCRDLLNAVVGYRNPSIKEIRILSSYLQNEETKRRYQCIREASQQLMELKLESKSGKPPQPFKALKLLQKLASATQTTMAD